MNIMIITENPNHVLGSVNRLMLERPEGQRFACIGFEGEAESALTELFNLDFQQDPNQHVIIIVDDIKHLWQGMRQLLDIVIETRNEEADEWLLRLFKDD